MTVEILDIKKEKLSRLLPTSRPKDLPASFGSVEWVGFSPDGRLLACGTYCGLVQCWDLKTGKEKFRGENPKGLIFWEGDFSPDGRFLAFASGNFFNWLGMVMVWDTQTGNLKASWQVYDHGNCTCLRFTPDGKSLVVGTNQSFGATRIGAVQLWDWPSKKLVRMYEAKKR
jgi:WD40 repeat protein